MLRNKKMIPLIFPPNPSEILSQMRLIESLKRIENKVVVVPISKDSDPIIMKEPNNIAIVGAGKLGEILALNTLSLSLFNTTKSNHTTIIDDRNYSEKDGNLMRIYSSEYFGEHSVSTQTYLDDSDYMSPKMSLQKKDRKQNNRKTKKRKKAKNGR